MNVAEEGRASRGTGAGRLDGQRTWGSEPLPDDDAARSGEGGLHRGSHIRTPLIPGTTWQV